MKAFTAFSFLLPALAPGSFAQTPRVEIGVQVSGIKESVFGEYPLGGGGRVTVHAFRFVDAEAEFNRFPIGGAVALFPGTLATFGARVGRRFGPLGVYGTVRPGLMRFDGNAYVPNLGTKPVLEIGGVLEVYSRRHFAGRLDFGDAVVWYGKDINIPVLSAPPGPGIVPGTRHQFQFSVGVSAWF